MRRFVISSALVIATAQVAAAQPAPPPQPTPAQPAAPAAPAEPAPPAAPAPAAEPAPVAAPVEPTPLPTDSTQPAAPTKKLTVGKGAEGFVQLGMLLQGWFVFDRADGASSPPSTFRLRRAELHVKGEILPKRVGFGIMIDPAKILELTNSTITLDSGEQITVRQPPSGGSIAAMQDFFITFMSSYADVSLGQFKIPVSWEGVNSSSKLILPERANASRQFGDKRDLGIRVMKSFTKWGYHAGIYNGSGLNNRDNNNQKDVALRLEAYPIKGLTLAGMTYDSIGYRNRAGTKDRWEADVRYETGPFLVQAEYIRARDITADGADPIKGHGVYGAVGYTITHPSLHGELQPVVRVGYLDTNTEADLNPAMGGSDELVHYDIGANYYLEAHEMKIQASYQRQQFDTKTPVNEVIVAAQVAY
ncbi:MAG: porin [Kofleriaceae bacterium]